MMKSALGLTALLLLAGGSASAADLDYSFLDLGYSRQIHDKLERGSGYELAGSYGLADNFFVTAAYKHNIFTDDTLSASASFDYSNHSYLLGGGYHYGLSASTDLVARVMYGRAYSETQLGSFSLTDSHSGYDLGIGLRGSPATSLELEAFVDHDDLGYDHRISTPCTGTFTRCVLVITNETDGIENVISTDARYRFTTEFSLGAGYRHSSLQSANEWLLYGRWSY